MQELSLEEMRSKTAQMLGIDGSELGYLDEDYRQADSVEFDPSKVDESDASGLLNGWYGHSLAYGARNGKATYEFKGNANGSISGCCHSNNAYWYYQSAMHHNSAGQNCRVNNNNTAVVYFTKK